MTATALTVDPLSPLQLAYSIPQLATLTAIGRTKLFHEIQRGRLRATHVGGRTVVTIEDARAWLANAQRDHIMSRGDPKPHRTNAPKPRNTAAARY